jgi:nucleoside-diphosphate-sugar epimerase
MKILLTGSSGSIGSALIPHLMKQGHVVTSLPSDIRDASALQKEIGKMYHKYDWVVHMAAIVTSVPSELAGPNTFDVNVTGTFNVASLAKELDARFCYFSTTVIYKPGESPYSEKSIPCPETLYAHTKLLGEQTAKYVFNKKPDRLLIVRPAFTYGSPNDHSLITTLLKNAKNNEYSIVRLSPEFTKTYTHTLDFCSAVEKLLIGNHSGDYNVSSHELVTLDKILFEMKNLGIVPRMYPRPELDYLQHHAIDNTKLVKTIDWHPRYDLRYGIAEIASRIFTR